MSTGPVRTAWHPLLVLLLRQLLPADGFEITGEFSLTREPLRLDVVVVRKLKDARPSFYLLPSLLEALGSHSLISFKGPTDRLEADDATMLLVYGSLYLVVARVKEPNEVTLHLVTAELTPRFREQLGRLGGYLRYQGAGVSVGKLGPFSLQVIETEQAFPYDEEHLWFVFTPSLLDHRPPPAMAKNELTFYQYIYQQIAQVRAEGDPLMYKDLELAKMSLEEAMGKLMADMPPGLRLTGIPPEILLAGISVEQRLAGLAPEQVGEALGRDGALLALPDDVLGALPDGVLATLSPGAREQVRKRTGR